MIFHPPPLPEPATRPNVGCNGRITAGQISFAGMSFHMSGIVWLASYPKSGNTWLRLFLANYFAESRPLDLNQAISFGVGDSGIELFRDAGMGRDDPSPESMAQLRPLVHRHIAQRNANGVSFVKTHNACIHVAGAPLITPDVTAGAILVVRNPFDVAVSFAHHNGMPIERSVEALATDTYYVPADETQVDQYPTSWRRFQSSWIDAAGLTPLILRYEDLTQSPAATFSQVLKFMNVRIDEARLAESIQATSFDALAGQEKAHGFVEGDPQGKVPFFRKGQIGAWQEVFTAEQVEFLRQACGQELVRLGYASESGDLTSLAKGSDSASA